jgi:hypothetical protein
LFDGDQLLASVKCQLVPPDAPASGIAQVPDTKNWLGFTELILVLPRTQQSYRISPTRIERTAGGPALLRFTVTG